MADRLVAVGSDFVLPKEVVVKPVNLPTYLSEEAVASSGGGAALVPDPNNPGLYFVSAGGQLEKDEQPGFYRIKGLN